MEHFGEFNYNGTVYCYAWHDPSLQDTSEGRYYVGGCYWNKEHEMDKISIASTFIEHEYRVSDAGMVLEKAIRERLNKQWTD